MKKNKIYINRICELCKKEFIARRRFERICKKCKEDKK